jgi:hypothetical protein
MAYRGVRTFLTDAAEYVMQSYAKGKRRQKGCLLQFLTHLRRH